MLHFSFYAFSTFVGAEPLDNSTDLMQALILVQECKPSALRELLKLSIQVIFMNIVFFQLLKFQWSECLCEHITGTSFKIQITMSINFVYCYSFLKQTFQCSLLLVSRVAQKSKNTKSVPSDFCASLYITSSDTNVIISPYNI